MATKFEKAFEQMTPAQRKKATEKIGNMMGMPSTMFVFVSIGWLIGALANALLESENRASLSRTFMGEISHGNVQSVVS